MQFCTRCGSVLNLFEFPDEEICYSCRKVEEKQTADPEPQQKTENSDISSYDSLNEATFQLENNQLVLRSPEGWTLWSGPVQTAVKFESIVQRANKIMKIRSKRNRKKS